jgi:hypothetical protein
MDGVAILGGHRAGVRRHAPLVLGRCVAAAWIALILVSPVSVPTATAADGRRQVVFDGQLVDMAMLPAADADATPDLLVLPTSDGAMADLAILHRGSAWDVLAALEIDLGSADLSGRWLVDLGDGQYALVASSQDQPAPGHAVVVIVHVTRGDQPAIDEIARQTFDVAIDSTGVGDVDGFGAPELVLGMRPVYDPTGICGSTALLVVDRASATVRRTVDLPPTIGWGVLGRFDEVPGDDLLLYVSPGCPPEGASTSRLVAVDFREGGQIKTLLGDLPGAAWRYPAPLRIGLDGSRRDLALATGADGLAVIDPQGGSPLVLGRFLPLLATAGSGPSGRDWRLALFDPSGPSLVVGDVRRDGAGLTFERHAELRPDDMPPARWQVLDTMLESTAVSGDPSGAWSGSALTPGCPDLIVPGAILGCGQDALRSSAAWMATRPIATFPTDASLAMLVASGLGWDSRAGPPRTPTPAAVALDGWWRRGPSTPFALSESDAKALVGREQVPPPSAGIGPTSNGDGSATMSGGVGDRLLTSVVPLSSSETPPTPAADIATALASRSGPTPGSDVVLQLPAPTGFLSATDRTSTKLDLSTFQTDAAPARWSVQVVPLDDRGEWGQPVTRVIAQDTAAPSIEVDDPFMSPIWPVPATLTGRTEPGSTVSVDGLGAVRPDADGRFVIERALAPWPQTFRVEATDPAGNRSVASFDVIGGIDYRRLPWPGIAAATLLAGVALRGLVGGRRPRAVAPGSMGRGSARDDGIAGPEIEELPPGGGVARS